MKILWAAMIGLNAVAWSFDGDWSAWDGTRNEEETKAEAGTSYRGSGPEAEAVSSYEIRAMGRSESRWMGSLEGPSPSLADLNGNSRFDWTRFLGRAEAHYVDGVSRTAYYTASDRAPISVPLAGKEMRCNLVEANRDKGRAEARDSDGKQAGSGKPQDKRESGEDADKAAAKEIGSSDC